MHNRSILAAFSLIIISFVHSSGAFHSFHSTSSLRESNDEGRHSIEKRFSISRNRLKDLTLSSNMVSESYNLSFGLGGLAAGSLTAALINGGKLSSTLLACVALFLTGYVTTKTQSVRFAFDEQAVSIVKSDGSSVGAHPVLGGDYSWYYKNIVNFKIFPSESLPILLYFKEDATPESDRVDPPVEVDQAPGQAHFFPMISDSRQIIDNFKNHGCNEAVPSWKLQRDPTKFIKGLQLI